jgi:hypothetical protein
MFLDELTPVVREMVEHPAAFLGGLASGLLRLNLGDDPVKGWLQKQGVSVSSPPSSSGSQNGGGPQTISIE